jgi:predicted metal-binding protein
MPEGPDVCVHVCVTCRAGEVCDEDASRPGRRLHEALVQAARDSDFAEWLALKEVSCLASCDHGCAAAVSMPGKWSYLLGRLDEAKVSDFLNYLRVYRDSRSGVVLPSRRAASLQNAVLARFPSLTLSLEGAA